MKLALLLGVIGFYIGHSQALGSADTLGEQLAKDGIRAIFPGDPDYTHASTGFNRRLKVLPAAITFPNNTSDVSLIVKAGIDQGLNVVARSGGHSYIANSVGGTNGSLVVDLSTLKKVTLDPTTNITVIETGNRLGEVATKLNSLGGRAIPHGRCTFVGFGGHSGFGGWGHASRMWGLTLDNILAATVVLANGTVVETSKDHFPELFWAIRGSSASFGIVTAVTMKTYPAPPSGTFFDITWNMDVDQATRAFTLFQDFVTDPSLPTSFGGELGLTKGSASGHVSVFLLGTHYGTVKEYNQTLAPFLDEMPKPSRGTVKSGTWLEIVAAGAVGPINVTGVEMDRDNFYAKSLMTPEDGAPLTEAAMRSMIEYLATEGFKSSSFWHVEMELYGGRGSMINSVPLDDTAFGHRNTLFTFQPWASSFGSSFDNKLLGFVDGIVSSITDVMPSDWNWGVYANYIDSRVEDWQHRYYGSHYERLQQLKRVLDPQNVFKFPTSIEL